MKVEIKVLSQEAYASKMYLNIDFEYKGTQYTATCVYYNGDSCEDVEVYPINEPTETIDKGEIYDIAEDLLMEMSIDEHLTY